MNISQSAGYESGTFLDASQTLQSILDEQHIVDAVSPQWIPEGFELSAFTAYPDIDVPTYAALYENPVTEQTIIASVMVHHEPQAAMQEKDSSGVTIFKANDVEHYIMNNNDKLVATWFSENLECSITGEISEGDMETMINSIYEE